MAMHNSLSKSRMVQFIPFLFLAFVSADAFSQTGSPPAPQLATTVTVDLQKHTVSFIPFDKEFQFAGTLDTAWKVDSLFFSIKKGRNDADPNFEQVAAAKVAGRNQFRVAVLNYPSGADFLLPDRSYTLKVEAKAADGSVLDNFTFTYGFLTSSKVGDHVKTDFGLGYAATPKALFGFTSVNLYLTPINDETDLQLIKSFRRNLFLRTSFFFGIAPLTLSSDTKQPVKNRYGLGNFVYGFAIRSPFYGIYTGFTNKVGQKLLQPMRLKVGWLLYTQANSNQLITKDVNKKAFFIGLSYDFSVAALLGPVGKIIQP